MKVEYAARTDVGRKRENNEDSHAADPEIGLYVVADGMGGHARGEVASGMVVEMLQSHLRGIGKRREKRHLVESLAAANLQVYERSMTSAEHRGMGTTTVAVLTLDGRVALAHVGDSRAYLLRKGTLSQITRDHTLVQQQIDEGRLRAEDAENVNYKNVLIRAIGTAHDVEADSQLLRIKEDDLILLCSDGLTGMVSDNEIAAVLNLAEYTLDDRAQALIDKANDAGGKDNVTVILLHFTEVQSPLEDIIQRVT